MRTVSMRCQQVVKEKISPWGASGWPAGRNGRPLLLAHAAWIAAGRKARLKRADAKAVVHEFADANSLLARRPRKGLVATEDRCCSPVQPGLQQKSRRNRMGDFEELERKARFLARSAKNARILS
jgi:hypothetical protein